MHSASRALFAAMALLGCAVPETQPPSRELSAEAAISELNAKRSLREDKRFIREVEALRGRSLPFRVAPIEREMDMSAERYALMMRDWYGGQLPYDVVAGTPGLRSVFRHAPPPAKRLSVSRNLNRATGESVAYLQTEDVIIVCSKGKLSAEVEWGSPLAMGAHAVAWTAYDEQDQPLQGPRRETWRAFKGMESSAASQSFLKAILSPQAATVSVQGYGPLENRNASGRLKASGPRAAYGIDVLQEEC